MRSTGGGLLGWGGCGGCAWTVGSFASLSVAFGRWGPRRKRKVKGDVMERDPEGNGFSSCLAADVTAAQLN